jgi:dCMP deaminase
MEYDKAVKYYKLAEYQASLFSKDPNTKVAAIFIAQDSLQILSTGFNGMCRNFRETEERWARPLKYKWVVHAEINGIANAARGGVKIEGCICVVTLFPCVECCKALIQSGVRVVISKEPSLTCERWGENHRLSLEMMKEAGIKLVYVE